MKNVTIPLALFAASFAASGSAQEMLAAKKPAVHLAIDADADFVLVALADRRLPVCGQWVLDDAVVVPTIQHNGRRSCKLPMPQDGLVDIFWQDIVLDAVVGPQIGEIRRYNANSDARAPTRDLLIKPVATDPPAEKPTLAPQDPPMILVAIRDDSAAMTSLFASFVAPTDGYGLALIDVVAKPATGEALVYLYRKLPGRGQGTLNIVEKHSLTVSLPKKCKRIRVFMAQGPDSRPHGAVTYKLLALLPH